MATDRLTLARAFSATGMPQEAAENVATAIFDAIHDNVATKADLRAAIIELKHDLTMRGLGAMATLIGVAVTFNAMLFAALHYWPPGHG